MGVERGEGGEMGGWKRQRERSQWVLVFGCAGLLRG